MNRTNGLVSPQFHVTFDATFNTVKQDSHDSTWQIKAGFSQANASTTQAQRESKASTEMPINQREPEISRKRKLQNKAPHTSEKEIAEQIGQGTAKRVAMDKGQERPQLQKQQQQQQYGAVRTTDVGNNAQDTTTRYGRKIRPVQRLINAMIAEIKRDTLEDNVDHVQGEIFCHGAMYPKDDTALEHHPLVAYKATSDPDTMYLHQAMKEPDREQFLKAMEKETQDQLNNGNFTVMLRSQVPKGSKILPMVWQMKRKRDITTGKVKKHKARLNVDGSKTQYGIHYEETYAPVASWNSIRMMLILSIVHGWHTRQLDYVLAYPQAPAEKPLYMRIPKGMEVPHGKNEDYVLKIHRNVYGQKNAGRYGTST